MVIVKRKLPFKRQRFTRLTNSQWQVIKDFVVTGRKIRHCLRGIVDAILKLNRTGCHGAARAVAQSGKPIPLANG